MVESGATLVSVHGLFIVAASLAAEHGPAGFSSCSSQALEHRL